MRVFLFLGLADAKWRFAIYLTNGKRRPAERPAHLRIEQPRFAKKSVGAEIGLDCAKNDSAILVR
jgi:hypothetical protein